MLSAVTVGVFAVFWVIVVPSARQLAALFDRAQTAAVFERAVGSLSSDWRRQFSLLSST